MTCYEMLLSLSPDSLGSGQKGVYSVCTTHEAVLEAALMRGRGEKTSSSRPRQTRSTSSADTRE